MRQLLLVLRFVSAASAVSFLVPVGVWFWFLHNQAIVPSWSYRLGHQIVINPAPNLGFLNWLQPYGGFPQLSFQLGGCLLCLWTTEKLLSREKTRT
jgi:hypothetical protein